MGVVDIILLPLHIFGIVLLSLTAVALCFAVVMISLRMAGDHFEWADKAGDWLENHFNRLMKEIARYFS